MGAVTRTTPTRDSQIRLKVSAERTGRRISFVQADCWKPDDVLQPPRTGWGFGTDEMFDSSPGMESLTIQGPFKDPSVGDTPSRRKLFACRPKAGSSAKEDRACARTILSSLARRAIAGRSTTAT